MYSVGRKLAAFIIAAAMLVAVAGCSGQPLSTREKGTGIGALLGAGTGFVVGNAMQNQEVKQQQTQSQLQSQQSEIEQQRRQIERLKSQSETE
jgi:TolA-binding protein